MNKKKKAKVVKDKLRNSCSSLDTLEGVMEVKQRYRMYNLRKFSREYNSRMCSRKYNSRMYSKSTQGSTTQGSI